MTGIALKKNFPDKKLVLRLVSGIMLSNLLVLMIFTQNDDPVEKTSFTQAPADYLEMSITGEFLTPFKKGKLVNILDKNKHTICSQAILKEIKQQEDFMGRRTSKTIVAVSSNCVPELIQKNKAFIIPHGKFKKIHAQRKRRHYEVRY